MRQRSEVDSEGADVPPLPLAEFEGAPEPASSASPPRRRADRALRSPASPAPRAQQPPRGISRELRGLQGVTFSQDPTVADSLRSARIAALSRASPLDERTEMEDSPELEAPPSSRRARRSTSAAPAQGEVADGAASSSASSAAAPPKRSRSPTPSAGVVAGDVRRSKKQRKQSPAPVAALGALVVATRPPPSSSSLASILNPALDIGSPAPSPSSPSTCPPWPTPALVVASDALPARRASKLPRRYGDGVVELGASGRASSSRTRQAPSAPTAPTSTRLPSVNEVGPDFGAAVRDEPFLTREPLGTRRSSTSVESARSLVPIPRQNLPPLPPLLAKSISAAPVASTSAAPSPPSVTPPKRPRHPSTKRGRAAASTSSSSTKAPKAPKEPKEPPHRPRHPALESQDSWVPVERNLRMTAAGKPPIWCLGRQELCESLEYFKSYQGGHYDKTERCLGYLLDGFPSPSDACASQGKVIISHGGGSSEVLAGGGTRLKADQLRDGPRIRALINCRDTSTPVVLLVGAMYEHFPKLKTMGEDGVRYAVLGHYLVTDIWPEGEPCQDALDGKYYVRFKVRFEWLASQGEPWFANVIGKDEPSSKVKTASTKLRAPSPSPELREPSAIPRPAAALAAPILPHLDAASSVHHPPTSTSKASTSSNPLADLRFKRIPRAPLLPDVGSDMDMSSDDSDSSPPSPRSSGSDHTVDSGFVDVTSGDDELDEGTCGTCVVNFKRAYREDVECYNEECDRFFLVNGKMPRPGSLTYRASFLDLTPSLPSSDLVPQALVPCTLQSLSGASQISDYGERAWRGFGCSTCGRLSSRSEWLRLVCAGCGAETLAAARTFGAAELEAKGKGRALEPRPTSIIDPYEATLIEGVQGYEGYSVDLLPAQGGGSARVHHLWPVDSSTIAVGDKLFEEYQGHEAGALFRRNKLARHQAAGNLLCQQFTFNSGERYSHAVSMETYPFPPSPSAPLDKHGLDSTVTCAPQCALDARDYLKTVVRSVVGDGPETNFNEILSVAYMTGGKMNYHDDGERGLGQYVASVSLGSDAIMSFRAKLKKPLKKGIKPDDEDDVDADDEADTGSTKQKDTSKKSRIVLKTRLKHGHVLIMEGADMQKLFEHKVEPEGLRFAATTRWVGPDHLGQRPQPTLTQPSRAPKKAPSGRAAKPATARSAPSKSRSRPSSATSPAREAPSESPVVARPALAPPSLVAAAIAAQLGVAPHDKRVRDEPRAHPRGSADPAPQLLHSHSLAPRHGVPILPPTAPPDAAFSGSTSARCGPQREVAPGPPRWVGPGAAARLQQQRGGF
ncbi:hypothetical protein JCM9279_005266 [Rhodotorula babjevae]